MSSLDTFDADASRVQRLLLLKRIERRSPSGFVLVLAVATGAAIAAGVLVAARLNLI